MFFEKKFLTFECVICESAYYETDWNKKRGKLAPVMGGHSAVLRKVSPVNTKIDRAITPLASGSDIFHVCKLLKYLPPFPSSRERDNEQ